MNKKIIAMLALIVSVIALGVVIAQYVKMPKPDYVYPHNTMLYLMGSVENDFSDNFTIRIYNYHNVTLYNCVLNVSSVPNITNESLPTLSFWLGTIENGSSILFQFPSQYVRSYMYAKSGYSAFYDACKLYGFTQ